MTRRQIPIVVASLLLLASVIVGLVRLPDGAGNSGPGEVPRGATEAAAMLSARTSAVAFFTLDPAKVEQQIDAVLANATGAFLSEYTAGREDIIKNVRTKKRTVSAIVPRGGTAIASFTTETAVVLVAIDATSQEGTKAPTTNEYRMLLTMKREGQEWKAATLDQLTPVPGAGVFEPGTLPGGNSAVVAAAANGVKHMLSSDYRTLDKDLTSTLLLLTGSFGSDYARTFDGSVRLIATKDKTVTQAYVRAVGLVVRDGDKARCMVFVDQVVNPDQAADVTQARLFADLRRVKGTWLIDGLSRA